MNQDNSYKKLMYNLPETEPGIDIVPAVMERVKRARTSRARLHAALHGSIIIAAIIAFVPALHSLLNSAAKSGFSEYVSLAISDSGSMLSSWQAFLLSVIETAPVVEMSVILGLVLIFANSLRRGARYVSSMRMTSDFVFA